MINTRSQLTKYMVDTKKKKKNKYMVDTKKSEKLVNYSHIKDP